MTRIMSLVVALVGAAAATAAAQSNIRNAQIEPRPAGDLAGTIQSLSSTTGPVWIAYAVPAQDPDFDACCYDGSRYGVRRGGCVLDGNGSSGAAGRRGTPAARTGTGSSPAASAPIALEPAGEAVVLYRVEDREVRRIRTYSASCELDAGGRTVYWLSGVSMPASIDVLRQFASRVAPEADGEGRDTLLDGATLAIAVHRDPSADRALAALMAPDRPARGRKQAAFWAANMRGRAGFTLVRDALADTSNAESFRKHLTFALSQSHDAEAIDTLIRAARRDTSAAVRGEAIFWLAQKAGQQAARTITDAIADDPDTKVKERAVFALSQLPTDEGVPKLIEVARNNRNPAVRKQAMFWLGQSKDPRALDFFADVLARP